MRWLTWRATRLQNALDDADDVENIWQAAPLGATGRQRRCWWPRCPSPRARPVPVLQLNRLFVHMMHVY
jgi:hypothetical protein